jgi:hypothetical protein
VLFLVGSLSPQKTRRTKKRKASKYQKKKNILNDLRWSKASRALFSGLDNKTGILGEFKKRIIQVVQGKMTAQQARVCLRKFLTTDGKDVLRELGFAYENSAMNEKDNLSELGSASRLKLIIEQNVDNILAADRYERLFETKFVYPYVEYCSGKNCNHHNLNGKIYKIGTPEMRAVYPPNDYYCQCQMRPIRSNELKGRKIERKILPVSKLSPSGFNFNPAEKTLILELYPPN